MPRSSKHIRDFSIAALAFLGLNFVWELSHSRLFTNYQDASRIYHALDCLQHAVTDLLIGTGTYLVASVAFRELRWVIGSRWRWPAATWLGLGLIVTVGIEIWATATGRWEYGEAMPIVLGIGVTPLLQWLIIPTGVLFLIRRLHRSQ